MTKGEFILAGLERFKEGVNELNSHNRVPTNLMALSITYEIRRLEQEWLSRNER